MRPGTLLFISFICIAFTGIAQKGADSIKTKTNGREPKHYLYNTIYTEFYSTPSREISTTDPLKLGKYKFSQSNTGFYFPIKTRDIHRDSVTIANLHTLLVGNFLKSTPHFDSLLEDHHLTRFSLGLRVMYNNGKKNVWFFNAAPCYTQDSRSNFKPDSKFTSMIIFNRTVSRNFSYRVGFTRTFIFGNKYHLPVLGVRIGPLDGVYASIQFPRSVSLNFPIGQKLYGSLYCKPFGGVYNFANTDTFANGGNLYLGRDSLIQFGRREYIGGFRLDYNPCKNFSLFASGGFSAYNKVAFFSHSFNPDKKKIDILQPFYVGSLSDSYFINVGMTWRFGKVKKAYNNYTMYDLIDMNNSIDPGDVNDGPGNGALPSNGNRTSVKDIQYKDVKDLLELDDNN